MTLKLDGTPRKTRKAEGTQFEEQFVVRMTTADAKRLDGMMIAGKYRSRAELVRSILLAILDDDDRAHCK